MQCEWKAKPEKPCGVLCGSDKHQEWLLPWWWERYHAENDFPVTFIDFGMTEEAHLWCKERGDVVLLDLDMSFIKPKEEIHPELVKIWNSWDLAWEKRKAWFKKPFALLQSPYRCAVWLDLDCEVLGSIAELFTKCDEISQLALVREWRSENLPYQHPDVVYNGGVIVFQHGSEIIQQCAKDTVTRNHCFAGDDFLLSQLIYEKRLQVVELPEIYNWRIVKGINLNTVIFHWVGKKNYIKYHGGIKPSMNEFYKRCSEV